MGFHTFDADRAAVLDDPARFAYCSAEELYALLAPAPDATVADIGSGTGLYTDRVAAFVGRVRAVDVQPEMHDRYRENGVPDNVDLVTAEAADLPFADGELDGVVSTFTFHEFADEGALAELRRVLAPGARVAVADWSGAGAGADGPPLGERFSAAEAESMLADAGFDVGPTSERRETFTLGARRN
ncbi:class I SAM-dependent methyltransferase [Halosegnis marinus]|uniref:Class I SAM-dependent methyltransferase n=1 Tax=Halosegnis marinus TaxID=3034023 RepID=A0ABD5ZKU2_9EURY|nr:class I SAM-dependent methyltransferase [Halosegnis sp. DT85]